MPNRGGVVPRLDVSQVFQILEVRVVLEGLAARLANDKAQLATWKEDLARFRGPLKDLVDRGELQEYIQHYEALRRKIIEAAGNPVLAEMLDIIFEKTQVLIRRIIILPGRAEIGRTQHVAMLQAMSRGDAEEAETIRRNGLRSARMALEKYQQFIL
jgi:DNA-binding GntR family transcriptional regulator